MSLFKHFGENPMLIKRLISISLLLAIISANHQLLAAEQKPKPCSSEQHRAFDFWIGEWEVTTKNQKTPPSTSSITMSNDGCSIHERYSTATGFTGNSINFYDSKTKKWHQTWIDNQGQQLYLNGEFKNGSMVLSDQTNRITWTLLGNKQVNQKWETTKNQGKTWEVVFDGFYLRK